jgi:uncharacterized protein with HEPN domain
VLWKLSRRLPDDFPISLKKGIRQIDWIAVAAAGNVYRHEYEAVDEAQVWHTAQYELVALREANVAELERPAES